MRKKGCVTLTLRASTYHLTSVATQLFSEVAVNSCHQSTVLRLCAGQTAVGDQIVFLIQADDLDAVVSFFCEDPVSTSRGCPELFNAVFHNALHLFVKIVSRAKRRAFPL